MTAAVLVAVGVTAPAIAQSDQDFVGAYAATATHQGAACPADGKATLDITKVTANSVSVSIGGGATPYAFDPKTATFSGSDAATNATVNGAFKRESGRIVATMTIALPDQCTTTLTGPRTGAVTPKPAPTLVNVPDQTIPGAATESTSKTATTQRSSGGGSDGPPAALLIGALAVVGALGIGAFAKSRTKGRRLLGELARACAARITAARTLRNHQTRVRDLDAALAGRGRAAELQRWWAHTASATASLVSPIAVLPETRRTASDPHVEPLTVARALARRQVAESQATYDAARGEVDRLEAEARELRVQIPTCADPYEYTPMEVA